MSTSRIGVRLLEFGRLAYQEAQQHSTERTCSQLEEAEVALLASLSKERSALVRSALGSNVDGFVLRVVCYVSYISLCTDHPSISISAVAKALGGEDPESILEIRSVVSRLLLSKRLVLRHDCGWVEPGQAVLDLIAGGKSALPLNPTSLSLRAAWRRADAEAKQRAARAENSVKPPTAKELAQLISQQVIGLDEQVRTFACRLALHLQKAKMLQDGVDPATPNEAILFVGPSGCGKTWLAESAGRLCGIPFGAVSSSDITCEGYVGLGVDDVIKQVITAANNDVAKARSGIAFFDEWDKKRVSGYEFGGRDVAGASVQQAVLRMIEGCEFQVGGRRGSYDWPPTTIWTRGMCFVFAGAFCGLERLLLKRAGTSLGFGRVQKEATEQRYLYDALQDFGMIPEFINRLSGVLVFPPPTIPQLMEIATRSVIPVYRRLLAASSADIEVEEAAVRLMASFALETRTYARGLKSIMARLVEDVIYEERTGTIPFSVADVGRAAEAAGLAAECAQQVLSKTDDFLSTKAADEKPTES